jgi:hypothetical protein
MMRTVLTTTEQIKGQLPQASELDVLSSQFVWHKSYKNQFDSINERSGG